MILIPIENIDGAFVVDDMLCLKPEVIESSSTPKLLELIQLWSQHGKSLSQEVFHRRNKNRLPENATIEFHENGGWGNWTIWVDVPSWWPHEDPPKSRINLYQVEYEDSERQKRTEPREKKITPGHIYLLESDNGFHKIGRTTQDIETRARQLERDFPVLLRVVHSFPASDTPEAERQLLARYKDVVAKGEWFTLSPIDVDEIKSIRAFSDGSFWNEGNADGEEKDLAKRKNRHH